MTALEAAQGVLLFPGALLLQLPPLFLSGNCMIIRGAHYITGHSSHEEFSSVYHVTLYPLHRSLVRSPTCLPPGPGPGPWPASLRRLNCLTHSHALLQPVCVVIGEKVYLL